VLDTNLFEHVDQATGYCLRHLRLLSVSAPIGALNKTSGQPGGSSRAPSDRLRLRIEVPRQHSQHDPPQEGLAAGTATPSQLGS
jgi:hypothetical protein